MYFSSHITFYLWKFDLLLFFTSIAFLIFLNLCNTVITILVFFFSHSNFCINYESVSIDLFFKKIIDTISLLLLQTNFFNCMGLMYTKKLFIVYLKFKFS